MPETNRSQGAPRREPSRDRGEETRPISKMARKRRRPIGVTILIRILQVMGTLLLLGVITGSLLLCYAAVYVKTAVMPKAHIDLSAYTLNENSIIYYEDKTSGQWRELQTLMGKENREIIEYKDIPEDLINAFVAIEDKRFWQHHGVDWKRTANGVLRMFTGGNIQGGSTITQQLIKNLNTTTSPSPGRSRRSLPPWTWRTTTPRRISSPSILTGSTWATTASACRRRPGTTSARTCGT